MTDNKHGNTIYTARTARAAEDYLPLPKQDPLTTLTNFLQPWSVGFDKQVAFFKELDTSRTKYPPYNIIELPDDKFSIELAVAGFAKADVAISLKEGVLTISGAKKAELAEDAKYVHKGIATRDFEQTFAIAEDVQVLGAEMQDGVLTVSLERVVPEEKKAKTIEIV